MHPSAPLTFVEEIVLLALDDTTGALLPMPLRAFNFTLAGALIADLAVRGRIDTDPQQLVVLNSEPTDDPLLDPGLATIAAAAQPSPVAHWLGVFAEWRPELEASALARLVARGILRQENKKLLWVFGSRRYHGFDRKDLTLEPTDPDPNASVIRQRRYARLKLSRNVTANTTNLRENIRLAIPELNLGGGIGAGDRHLAPGSLLTLKFTHGVRHIKAQAVVRGARPQAMAFEFVEMDLDERSRLRKLLMELGGLPMAAQVSNRTRRRGRIAMLRN